MNALLEPFYLCLVASMLWAPFVFLAAGRYCNEEHSAMADKIWPIALLIAALPALLAPAAAAMGVSLRTEKPLPPMAEPALAGEIAPVLIAAPSAAQPTFDAGALLQAGAALYFYAFFLILALSLARLIGFSYRARCAFDIDEPLLEARLEKWRRRMGVRRRLRYAFTDAVSSVCVHGFFRPVILLPMNLLDRVSLADAALMGAHEMAHIRRGDTVLFAFAKLVKAIFWFNPFIHRICARTQLAAEQAADALVISRGVDRREYARCFVQGLRAAAGLRANERELAPSFTPFDKRSRRERLDAILSRGGAAALLNWPSKIGLLASLIAASAIACAQAAFAVAPKPAGEALPETPLEGPVSLGFGETSAALSKDRPSHEGVDIRAARGSPVRAAGDGKVIGATSRYKGSRAWGNVVVVDHGHGLVTRYAHLDGFHVQKGDRVKAGDVIGAVGSTGKATGPHLHFEVIRDGVPINPAPVFAAKPMPAPEPLPVIKPSRAVAVAPAPEIAPPPGLDALAEPSVAPTPEERLSDRLSERFEHFGERFADAMEDLEHLDIDIGDFDFDFDEIAQAQRVAMASLEWSGDFAFLSEEDRSKIEHAHRRAINAANAAMHRAERERQRAEQEIERAERERERAERARQRKQERIQRERATRERNRERAEAEAERARERAERDFEQSMNRAENRAERALKSAERDWARAMRNNDTAIDEQEILNIREKALHKAKADLEREIADIKRQRAELKRRQASQSDGD